MHSKSAGCPRRLLVTPMTSPFHQQPSHTPPEDTGILLLRPAGHTVLAPRAGNTYCFAPPPRPAANLLSNSLPLSPAQQGKVALITGGDSGIGRSVVSILSNLRGPPPVCCWHGPVIHF